MCEGGKDREEGIRIELERLPRINLKRPIERFLTSPDGRVISKTSVAFDEPRYRQSTRLSRVNSLSLPRG